MKKFNIAGVISICLSTAACSIASSIQRADTSTSGFDGAFYDGEESILRDDIPDSEAFRIFHQGATGFVSVQSVRISAERRARTFCEDKGLSYELLRATVSAGAHVAGNFPRAELVFACLPAQESMRTTNTDVVKPGRYDELRELKALLDEGVITLEEYEKEKSEVLAR